VNTNVSISKVIYLLILAGLSACQQVALQPLEPPASQNSQAKKLTQVWIEWKNNQEANRYELFINDILYEADLKQNYTNIELIDLVDAKKISVKEFDQQGHILNVFEQIFQANWVTEDKKSINFEFLRAELFNTTSPFSIGTHSLPWICAKKFPQTDNSIDLGWFTVVWELLRGEIYDDKHQKLNDVKVTVRSYNKSISYFDEMKTVNGQYLFPCSPGGIQLEITASKPGFTTRKEVVLLTGNKGDDPNANRYDFGVDGKVKHFLNYTQAYRALSDKPEVTLALPSRYQKQVSPNTAFVLTFSEPMDRQSIENSFAIRSFVPSKLSVDVHSEGYTFKGPVPIQREYQPESFKTGETLPYYSNLSQYPSGTPIFDSSAFDISWNADDTQATFAFKPGKALPTNKDPAKLPIYTLAFDAFSNHQRDLKDKSGVARSEKHFKLTDGDFEEALAFEVQADTLSPRLEKVVHLDLPMHALAFALTFSEPMMISTHSLNIAGGMADTLESCKQAPAGYPGANVCTDAQVAHNYTVKITGLDRKLAYQGLWADLGGEASYASWDPTFKTVVLTLRTLNPVFLMGSRFEVTALTDFSDPAGNPISTRPKFTRLITN
jgi:hypothetical protein